MGFLLDRRFAFEECHEHVGGQDSRLVGVDEQDRAVVSDVHLVLLKFVSPTK
jgi:hypothetical protein